MIFTALLPTEFHEKTFLNVTRAFLTPYITSQIDSNTPENIKTSHLPTPPIFEILLDLAATYIYCAERRALHVTSIGGDLPFSIPDTRSFSSKIVKIVQLFGSGLVFKISGQAYTSNVAMIRFPNCLKIVKVTS